MSRILPIVGVELLRGFGVSIWLVMLVKNGEAVYSNNGMETVLREMHMFQVTQYLNIVPQLLRISTPCSHK